MRAGYTIKTFWSRTQSCPPDGSIYLHLRAFCRLSAGIAALLATSYAQTPETSSFVVAGSATHQQHGKHPFLHTYTFTARASPTNWSLSLKPEQASPISELLAVGNHTEVFISYDFAAAVHARRSGGHAVGRNDSEALVLSNGVPCSMHMPVLGAIWLTYLSAATLAEIDPERTPVPIPCNVVSGNNVPALAYYYQKAGWIVEPSTGLPNLLESFDDGVRKHFDQSLLVRQERYSRPFQSGFTNIVFAVQSHQLFRTMQLPERAMLDVWWLPFGKQVLERIQSFTVTTKEVNDPPATPIPPPQPRGLASVTDLRIATSNGPVLLHYMSNRFLSRDELEALPSYQRAVADSLAVRPRQVTRSLGHYYFWLGVGLLGLASAVLISLRGRSVKQERSRP